MLPQTATRMGWNRNLAFMSRVSVSARTASCSGLHSQGMLSSAMIWRAARSASSARAPSFCSTLATLFSSSSTLGPQNMYASLPGISSMRTRRSATRGYSFAYHSGRASMSSSVAPASTSHGRAACTQASAPMSLMYWPFIQSSLVSSKTASFLVMRSSENSRASTSRGMMVVSPSSDHPRRARKFTRASGR